MKIQKFNESYKRESYWIFQDDFLKIRKLPIGSCKGKILFRFYNEQEDNWTVCSMILGCAKLINTKYEHNNELRKIEIGEYRKHNISSINAILRLFCQNDEELITRFKKEWTDEIQNIVDSAINFGDIIDRLKDNIYEQADLIFKSRKYNI